MGARQKAYYQFGATELSILKQKVLHYVNGFSTFCFLDNNQYNHPPCSYELLAAADDNRQLTFEDIGSTKDWIFGHCPYQAGTQSPALACCFVPKTVIYIAIGTKTLIVESMGNATAVLQEIQCIEPKTPKNQKAKIGHWHCPTAKQQYLNTVANIREDIASGKYYELNYCLAYTCTAHNLDACSLYKRLNAYNPAPFSCYLGFQDQYIIGASPERFLHLNQNILTTQPIKGTAARGQGEAEETALAHELMNSIKERAEHVMIVDLSRNDLAQVCELGSIKVPELFGIYTFPTVQHMISSIEGTLAYGKGFLEIWSSIFPMGSMTGAPKLSVTQAIAQYEAQDRSLYSGSTFYIEPSGDFDSNVAIRSLFYNKQTQQLSFYTGSAITYDSIAMQEWEELQLKAAAMRKVVAEL